MSCSRIYIAKHYQESKGDLESDFSTAPVERINRIHYDSSSEDPGKPVSQEYGSSNSKQKPTCESADPRDALLERFPVNLGCRHGADFGSEQGARRARCGAS
jgi:hypothetical protein